MKTKKTAPEYFHTKLMVFNHIWEGNCVVGIGNKGKLNEKVKISLARVFEVYS